MKLKITNRIIHNEKYKNAVKQLSLLEKERIFCKHDMEHFLNTARIAVILCFEKGINADTDAVYSAALLHDLGRIDEYDNGTPHHIASVKRAKEILSEVNCKEEFAAMVLSLISNHRNKEICEDSMEKIFYLADKKSRNCFCCQAQKECNWSEEKRNMEIKE